MHWLEPFPRQHELYMLSPATSGFEQAYTAVRALEGRLLPDEIVRDLPDLPPGHALKAEWEQRKPGFRRLMAYLRLQKRPFQILDLGCGNGWFTRHLAAGTPHTVLGMDINLLELKQAARLFAGPRCHFAYADVFQADIPAHSFDLVICNGSVQYFPDLKALVGRLKTLAQPNAALHVIDSPVYPASEVPAARERTQRYYCEQGIPEMAAYYFHLSREEVAALGGRFLYQPQPVLRRLAEWVGKPLSPFPWIQFPL